MRVFHHETVTATARPATSPVEVNVQGDGFSASLVLPAALGGSPRAGTTNPEQLFGSAYSGCMVFAIDHAARLAKLDPAVLQGLEVTASVKIGRATDRTNHLEADLLVRLPGMTDAEAEALCQQAVRYCPFHQALEGNVTTSFRVSGAG